VPAVYTAAAALQGASSGVLCMLLKAGTDPLAVNKLRLTPVQLAQRHGHTAAAALLQRAAEDKLKAHTK
jgi:ankyrin repeat protein